MYLLSSLPQLNVATTGAAICDQIFSLVTNIPCFSLIKILLLVTTCKSENLGVSWPQGLPESRALVAFCSCVYTIYESHCILMQLYYTQP